MDSREPPQASPPSRIDSPKRGRPRKYSPLAPTPLSSDALADLSPTSDEPPAKKSRGRLVGSGKTFVYSLGVGGTHLTAHVILVNTGEDIVAKITSFCEKEPSQVCILSAHGEVSSATLQQPTGSPVSYEGPFQIISLSGSFNPSEEGGCGTGGMTMMVALGGSDGKMVGGSVSGMLVAASETQVIVSSFIVEGKKKSSPKEKSGPSQAAMSSGTQGVSSNSSDEKDDSSSRSGSDS